jgi:signal transduction histidine kinase
LAQGCNAPIYAQNQTYFGNGIVGGRLLSYEAIGLNAAEIGVRILAGESALNIPPQTVPSVTMVDWRQLHRWGISETQVPPGSVVRYKEFSVWELYKWRIVGAISLIVLQALGIVWLLFTRAKRRQAEERSTGFAQLAESKHQALQQLTGRLLMLQDEERRRVAGELHDGLGQSLAIIKNRALIGLQDQTNHESARDQLSEIAETTTAAILEVREIAHNLRPYQLDRLGLVAAIKHMITRVSESSVLNVASDMERIDGLLSPEAETSVYRIVQEGLNNVVKHSSATSARVEIKRDGDQITISVQDNGKGISPRPPSSNGARGGFGLAGIAERVRLLDGSFAIDSKPSNGTTLTVLLELPGGAE